MSTSSKDSASLGVPLVELGRQNSELQEELLDAAKRLIGSSQFVLGREVEVFEQRIAAEVGTYHAVGVSSGTDALLAALMALEIGPGDEVVVPAFTFFATAGSVARLGARPVFADVCPACFNLDCESLEKVITPATKAIIPVHLFGQAAEMDTIQNIARERGGIPVIEDCAQSQGARYRSEAVGGIGEMGCFSFFPTKNLSGFGDGGAVTTNDDQLAERLRQLRNHGMHPKYHHGMIGGNFRLDALQAAMLSVKIAHVEGYLDRRRENAAFYLEHLGAMDKVELAQESDCGCIDKQRDRFASGCEIVLPVAYEHNDPTWNQFTIRVIRRGARDRLVERLRAANIGCEIYYPRSLDQQDCFAEFVSDADPRARGLRVSHTLSQQVLSLPIFPEITRDELQRVVDVVGKWVSDTS